MTKADVVINEIVEHINRLNPLERVMFLNATIWMMVDKTRISKHDKVGILETTKFKIMGDEYGRYNSEFKT
jgi:hypothetical protein